MKIEDCRAEIDSVDREMALLFEKRMKLSVSIGKLKKKAGMPVRDTAREKEVVSNGMSVIGDKTAGEYYPAFQNEVMRLSREAQKGGSVFFAPLATLPETLGIRGKVLVIGGYGVPVRYTMRAVDVLKKAGCEVNSLIVMDGEAGKTAENTEFILGNMLYFGLDRNSTVIAVGGGTLTDTVGFAASVYMRGIRCCCVPTTLLAMADASVGGKTGINFGGIKNTVGSFARRDVLCDVSLLESLPGKMFCDGAAEIIKIAAVADAKLFGELEKGGIDGKTIERAVRLKEKIVREDEFESGKRKILNFGHTVGHAAEMAYGFTHGEAVAQGMMIMSKGKARERIEALLRRYGFERKKLDGNKLVPYMEHDKKSDGDRIELIFCTRIGSCKTVRVCFDPEILNEIAEAVK